MKLYTAFKKEDDTRSLSIITVTDQEKAEKFWIKDAQKQLHNRITSGSLKRLCPQTQNGIIVVGGRAERWMDATWNRQAFILLPENHPFSNLVAKREHVRSGHLGITSTIAKIRSKYWILSIKKVVKRIRNNCVVSKLFYLIYNSILFIILFGCM